MRFSFPVLVSILLSLTSAAPILEIRDTSTNSSLPNVKIFATGGTIASKGTTSSQTANYNIGLTAQDLIDAVPDLQNVANLDYIQISNVGSNSLNYTHLIPLYHNISDSLAGDLDGAVVTHGTDTLEETAFFLDLTVKTQKPIVLAGAMRPSTATSADGPMNLYQAVSVAASDKSRGRGTLIAMNDRIASGFYSTKINANTLNTFAAQEMGFLGAFVNNDIEYYYSPVSPDGFVQFDISNVTDPSQIPKVEILYSYQGLDPDIVRYAIEDLKAEGIILAGSGAGSWTNTGDALNEELMAKYGVPIIRSHRTVDGTVPIDPGSSYISSGYLNPQKSRILLQLALYSGYSNDQIRDVFANLYGG